MCIDVCACVHTCMHVGACVCLYASSLMHLVYPAASCCAVHAHMFIIMALGAATEFCFVIELLFLCFLAVWLLWQQSSASPLCTLNLLLRDTFLNLNHCHSITSSTFCLS
uniref:Uncharacterized protein n=1 Tax=Eutreptiella gymnastica TaxID=73025 RepID=A0A7S4CT27_9EUGL